MAGAHVGLAQSAAGARHRMAVWAGGSDAGVWLNVAVGGYTDNVGTDQLNQGLSEQRAGPGATIWCNKEYRQIR